MSPYPSGDHLVAGRDVTGTGSTFHASNPRSGEALSPAFRDAGADLIREATDAAAKAAPVLQAIEPRGVAALLEAVAGRIADLGSELTHRSRDETGLGEARLESERVRTCNQLRMFADLVRSGRHLDVIIDHADDESPELRRTVTALGPVAVFGASNFPLAFGVAGGDTASALAAGCPVITKAHPSNPGTSELVGRAIVEAISDLGLPPGTFSLVQGAGHGVGERLVTAAPVAAVGFTGSLRGGSALFDLAAQRADPIPVYAEMGSLNPIFVTAAALKARGSTIAEDLAASMALGTGQFCTKPGLVFVPAGSDADEFVQSLIANLRDAQPGVMLNAPIHDRFERQVLHTGAIEGIHVTRIDSVDGAGSLGCSPVVARVDYSTWRATDELTEEHFGPFAAIVECRGEEFLNAAQELPGSLTATVHAEDGDPAPIAELRDRLAATAGRLIFNGFPTGVAVTGAMHHGGPYPATTTPLHTSVGETAIRRFLRPVTYQGFPSELLPVAVRDDNPWGVPRVVDGTVQP